MNNGEDSKAKLVMLNGRKTSRWKAKEFVEKIKEKPGALFLSRKVEGKEGPYELHDPQRPYRIRENSFPWRDL